MLEVNVGVVYYYLYQIKYKEDINMSKEMKLYFGKDGDDKFKGYDIGNTFIGGGTGSGLCGLMENLIEQMILQYDPNDWQLAAWDGAGVDIVPLNSYEMRGLYVMPNKRFVTNHAGCSLFEFFNIMLHICNDRAERNDTEIPLIIFINEFHIALRHDSEKFIKLFSELLEVTKKANAYVIAMAHILNNNGIPDSFMDMFDLRVCTRADKKLSEFIIKSSAASYISDKHGYAYVLNREGKREFCSVPFYSNRRKRSILTGDLLPNGCKFNSENLELWGKYGDLFRGDNDYA